MFSGSLQPTDTQDDSNMYALSYSAKSSAVRRFTSVLFIVIAVITVNKYI